MAEEEESFTFVDKRRNVPDAVPEMAAASTESAATVAAPDYSIDAGGDSNALEAETDTNPAPTTYDLIGYCINLLSSQAWQKLGLLADPQTGEARPDLPDAKIAIDAVSDLAARIDQAPDTAVPSELRRDLRTLVNDLRLNYVSQRGPTV